MTVVRNWLRVEPVLFYCISTNSKRHTTRAFTIDTLFNVSSICWQQCTCHAVRSTCQTWF